MKKLGQRSLLALCGLILIHGVTAFWDSKRIEKLASPLWTLPISKDGGEKSKTSIGLGYLVMTTEHEYDVGEKDLLLVREYELEHWFFPWKIAFAGSPKEK
jgi:hypothetical protein